MLQALWNNTTGGSEADTGEDATRKRNAMSWLGFGDTEKPPQKSSASGTNVTTTRVRRSSRALQIVGKQHASQKPGGDLSLEDEDFMDSLLNEEGEESDRNNGQVRRLSRRTSAYMESIVQEFANKGEGDSSKWDQMNHEGKDQHSLSRTKSQGELLPPIDGQETMDGTSALTRSHSLGEELSLSNTRRSSRRDSNAGGRRRESVARDEDKRSRRDSNAGGRRRDSVTGGDDKKSREDRTNRGNSRAPSRGDDGRGTKANSSGDSRAGSRVGSRASSPSGLEGTSPGSPRNRKPKANSSSDSRAGSRAGSRVTDEEQEASLSQFCFPYLVMPNTDISFVRL